MEPSEFLIPHNFHSLSEAEVGSVHHPPCASPPCVKTLSNELAFLPACLQGCILMFHTSLFHLQEPLPKMEEVSDGGTELSKTEDICQGIIIFQQKTLYIEGLKPQKLVFRYLLHNCIMYN